MITTITRSMLTARRPITQEIVAAKVSSPVIGISVGVVAWWSMLQRRAAVPFNLDPYSYDPLRYCIRTQQTRTLQVSTKSCKLHKIL